MPNDSHVYDFPVNHLNKCLSAGRDYNFIWLNEWGKTSTANTRSSLPHNNIQAYLTVDAIIRIK